MPLNPQMSYLAVQHKAAEFTRAADQARRARDRAGEADDPEPPVVLSAPMPSPQPKSAAAPA